jgi:hypothetical protein
MEVVMKKTILFVGIAILLMFSVAQATPFTFDLSVPNSALSPYSGPYANVSIDLTSATTATITVMGYSGYFLGSEDILALNTVGSATASGFSFDANPNSGNDLDTKVIGIGSGNVSDFGNFSLALHAFDGYPWSTPWFSFTLTKTSGTWADAASVLTLNSDGFLAAGHIYVNGGPSGALVTGFAGNGIPQVPEPSALLLLGSGLLGFALYNRRRFKK